MTIKHEEALRNFEFWGPAANIVNKLTPSELDAIEEELNSLYPEGLDATTLNDMFAYDLDIYGFIGETEESILERN